MNLETVVKNNFIDKKYILNYNKINILVVNDAENKPWFKCKDICDLLRYKNKRMLHDINSICNIKVHPQTLFLNKKGLMQILTSSRQPNIDKITVDLGIKTLYRYKRKEIEILDELAIFLGELDVRFVAQRRINSYRVDIYVPKYKLVIEIDENNHMDRNKILEELRDTY